MGRCDLVKRLFAFIMLFFMWTAPAWAVNSAITGTVTNIDGTTCNNCTVMFNSLETQVISGVTYQPLLVSTKTNGAGVLSSITLPQGLAVQVTVSEAGTTFPSYTAIVPFLSSATFDQLNQGITTDPLNVLASNQPPTGSLSMNSQKITNLACPTTGNDALAWGCNATIANLTVTGTFNQSGTAGENFTGLLTVSQIATPSAPTITAVGTTGATTYYYFVVCHDSNGGTTLGSASGSITNANATLSGTNYDSVAWTLPTNAVNCDILRNTANTITGAQSITGGLAVKTSPTLDESNTTSVYTVPTRNTTGDGQFAGALSAGTVATGIATGDLSAARAAGTGMLWLGSNGSQDLDFGITNASNFTLLGGGLTVPTGGINSGTFATGEATGDMAANRTATTGKLWIGSNGSQALDFGVTTGSTWTLSGGGLTVNGGNFIDSGTLTAGTNGGTGGTLTLKGATSGSAGIAAAAVAGTPTALVLPTTNATAGQYLKNDGSANLSWATPASNSTTTFFFVLSPTTGATPTTNLYKTTVNKHIVKVWITLGVAASGCSTLPAYELTVNGVAEASTIITLTNGGSYYEINSLNIPFATGSTGLQLSQSTAGVGCATGPDQPDDMNYGLEMTTDSP